MKTKRTLFCLMMSVIILMCSFMPALNAEYTENPWGISDEEYARILEFLEIVNPETGIKNGQQLCLDDSFLDYDESDEAKYQAVERITVPYSVDDCQGEPKISCFYFFIMLPPEEPDEDGIIPCFPCYDPEIYGYFDYSNSDLKGFQSNNNHLTGINLSNCGELRNVECSGDIMREAIFDNCPNLKVLNLRSDTMQVVKFTPYGMEESITIDILGKETANLWVRYKSGNEEKELEVSASSLNEGTFLGWYADGEFVTSNTNYRGSIPEARLTAVFAGDVNNDQKINSADAVIIMREALNLGAEGYNGNLCDVDANGIINVADAVTVMRFALNLR